MMKVIPGQKDAYTLENDGNEKIGMVGNYLGSTISQRVRSWVSISLLSTSKMGEDRSIQDKS